MDARSSRSWHCGLLVGACVAVALVAACRQLVGIGDRTLASSDDAGAGACGLALPVGDCRACVESKCCSPAAACAGSPACAENEECVGECGTDENCVERCQVTYPAGTEATVPALDTCIAAECAVPCKLQCGSHAGFVASPDAGPSCATCIAANACNASQACGASLGCETIYRCEGSCSTLDCATACELEGDAGALFSSYGALLDDCAVECGLGQNWTCVGHVSWPAPIQTSNAIQAVVTDVASFSPTVDAGVLLCGQEDVTCAQPLAQTTTDANGAFTLHYTLPNLDQGGLEGYLQLTSSAIAPSLFFWNFPLSQPVATFGITLYTVGADELPGFLTTLGASQVPGHGLAFIGMVDCSHNPAVGARVTVTQGSDSHTQTFYRAGASFSAKATGTNATGVAILANLLVGPVTIQVTTAAGLVVSQDSFLVTDGAAEEVVAVPTPQ